MKEKWPFSFLFSVDILKRLPSFFFIALSSLAGYSHGNGMIGVVFIVNICTFWLDNATSISKGLWDFKIPPNLSVLYIEPKNVAIRRLYQTVVFSS